MNVQAAYPGNLVLLRVKHTDLVMSYRYKAVSDIWIAGQVLIDESKHQKLLVFQGVLALVFQQHNFVFLVQSVLVRSTLNVLGLSEL